jgi:hypothetical protein
LRAWATLLTPPIFGPNHRANQDATTSGQHEPSLAVSRVHTNTVVVAAKDYRANNVKQVWIYASTDGGVTWPTQLHMPGVNVELNNQSDPVVMARDDGRIYVASVAYTEPERNRGGVFITWSDDDGATWRDPSVPVFYPENSIDDKGWFAVDNSPSSPFYHRLYMMYSPGANNVVEQHSTDGGLTWSARQEIAGSRYEYTYPVVAADGTVYNFMMYNWGASNLGTIQFVKSTDGGLTWSNRFTVAQADQPDSPIRPGDQFRFFAILSAAVDPVTGNLYVAWTDKRDVAANGTDVLYVRSTDAGSTWTPPARLSHDPAGVVRDHITPMLSAGADGRLHAFWLDRRLDPNNRRFDSWYTSTTDGGVTWDPDTRVSTASQDLNVGFPPASGNAAGDYWGLDTARDTVYAAWNDSRTGDQDILVSRGLMYGPATGTPTPTPTPGGACPGAYHYFQPQAGSPASGGTILVGQRFSLNMMVGSGSNNIAGQQAYLTFTNSLLQNINALQSGCATTSTVTGDLSVLDAPGQNEVCNGPAPCSFGSSSRPGSIAWTSTAGNNPPGSGDFRVAGVAFCATAPGQARIHWQFSPPAPITRTTTLHNPNGAPVQTASCYTDYVLNVLPGVTQTPTRTATPTATPPFCAGAYHYLRPQGSGPPNGGTVSVGDRFTLDMLVSAGPDSITAQQAYLTFTYSLLQNVDASQPGCVPTNTITADLLIFDVDLQNEVCNGPRRCVFRGAVIQPGSIGFASGALVNPPYAGPDFRAAQVAFCATAPGRAFIHWQFSPPAPPTRDTEVVEESGIIVNVRTCYTDYTINITGPAPTPTATPSCSIAFSDVHPEDYFYEPVRYLFCAGAISGYSDNTYRPGNSTTRAQLTKILVLAKGWAIDLRGAPHFNDVPPVHAFFRYVETAYNHGVISGYADHTFHPGYEITRAQLCKVVVLAQGWAITTSGGPHFSDVPQTDPFYPYIETTYAWGVISGYADGTFRPASSSTRAQVSRIVYNALLALSRGEGYPK